MNQHTMNRLSTFELLPNELLIDIFEYIPVQDLYKTFFGLNSRLTTIINSFQGFRFEQSEYEVIDASSFAHRITTLVIRHSNPIDLTRYPHLLALKLEWPNRQQCSQTIHQSQLEHLHIGHASCESDTDQLLKHVFANGFPQLRSCYLQNFATQSFINESSSILSNLFSLKILTVHPQDIVRLLSLCPNLNRLSIKFFRAATIDFNIVKQWLPTSQKNLRTLIFDSVDQMSIETIDAILAFVPNVKYLSINSPLCKTNKINIERIAHSLHQRLPNLCQFHASIWCVDLVRNNMYTDNIKTVCSLHPLFKQTRLSSRGGRLIISSSSYRSKFV